MSPIKRYFTIVLAVLAVAAGTLLLMGNLRGAKEQTIRLEQARVEALARSWETRLAAARSTFRDQVIRYGLLDALDHSEEWSQDRIEAKFIAMANSWGKDAGVPRAMVLMRSDGTIHSLKGDTTRMGEGLEMLSCPEKPDICLLPRMDGKAELLLLTLEPPPVQVGHRPAKVIALVDPAGFVSGTRDVPGRWVLLSGPSDPLIVSQGANLNFHLSDSTWPLLLSEGNGMVPLADGSSLCFSRIQIPGMKPLMVVRSYKPAASATRAVGVFLVILGVGGLLWLRLTPGPRQPSVQLDGTSPAAISEDSAGFRQIFHALDDPLCIVDSNGAVLRANNKAHRWFQFHKGVPRGEIVLWREEGECRLQELLYLASQDPDQANGPFGMVIEGEEVVGIVHAVPFRESDDGEVLVHFRLHSSKSERSSGEEPKTAQGGPDPKCPYPALEISDSGLVIGFNESALRACPRLNESPLISDILPEIGEDGLPGLLEAPDGHSFESLFGRQPHEFKVVKQDGIYRLYGHPLAASKSLEIELKQNQENFYTLCAMSPVPVLLADPRDHSIIEVNPAAADLFGTPLAALRGQKLESLAAETWQFSPEENLFVAQSLSGRRTPCQLRYELVKVEGVPTLLFVLDPLVESPASEYPVIPQPVVAENPSAAPGELLPLPPGPGLLITLSPTVRETARRMLDKTGHACESFSSLDDVTVWLITHDVRPELVAIDLTDYDDVGSWLEELRARCGDVPCLGFTDGDSYLLPNNGPNAFLTKPFDFESLIEVLSALDLESELSAPTQV